MRLEQRWSLAVTAVAALCGMGVAGGCGGAKPSLEDGKTPAPGTTSAADAAPAATQKPEEPPKPKHYQLNRTVYEIVIDPIPAVRTRCWLTGDADAALVEWDPAVPSPPHRLVALRSKHGALKAGMGAAARVAAYAEAVKKAGEYTNAVRSAETDANAAREAAVAADAAKIKAAGAQTAKEKAAANEDAAKKSTEAEGAIKKAADAAETAKKAAADANAARRAAEPAEWLTLRCNSENLSMVDTEKDSKTSSARLYTYDWKRVDGTAGTASAEIAGVKIGAVACGGSTFASHAMSGTLIPLDTPAPRTAPDPKGKLNDKDARGKATGGAPSNGQKLKTLNSSIDVAAYPCLDGGPTLSELGRLETTALAQPRSLEPLASIGTELLTVIADVAIDRAKAGAVQQAKYFIDDQLCSRLTRSALAQYLPPKAQSETDDVRLLPRTCNVIMASRLEELAASSKTLERALAADLVNLSIQVLIADLDREQHGVKHLKPILKTVEQILGSLIDGRSISSERDVQLLLLEFARVGMPGEAAGEGSSDRWQCAIEAGFSVLAECIQRGNCSAERLQRSLQEEFEHPSEGPCKKILRNDARWQQLASVLARSIDVFRPPSGTSANATAKAAMNVIFDLIEFVLEYKGMRVTSFERQRIDLSRRLANAVLDKDVASALVAAGAFVVNSIDRPCVSCDNQDISRVAEYCQVFGGNDNEKKACADKHNEAQDLWDRGKGDEAKKAEGEVRKTCETVRNNSGNKDFCSDDEEVRITSANARKAFALLNGFISYASTYQKAPSSGNAAEDAAREKVQHEERKKAMESLINSVTDRSGRGRNWVASLGVGVGFQVGRWGEDCNVVGDPTDTCDTFYDPIPNLSLPMGFAIQYLPAAPQGGTSRRVRDYLGFHLQLNALDIGQYATFNQHGDVAEPTIASATLLGGAVGVLIGSPETSFLLGLEGGYAPGLELEHTETSGTAEVTTRTSGMYRFGAFVGTYIPFWDFN